MRAKLSCLLALGLAACGDDHTEPAVPRPASVEVPVEVPAGMDTAPFDQPRMLVVPPGFGIRVVARIPAARFLAETPEGDLLVSRPGDLASRDGQIFRVAGLPDAPATSELGAGMTLPHDMVFTQIGGTTYLYVAETHRISRVPWTGGAALGTLDPVVDNLPSASLPELMGNYGHALKNIAISNDTLFISIASATNYDPADILADPVRGSIYAYDLEGRGGRLFAKGIRNAEGLALHPRTGELWVAFNHRDNVRYPLRDGRFAYGEAIYDWINHNPPEPFTRVRDGGNYGWPYCNPVDEVDNDNMPYVPDIDNNEDENVLDCSTIDRIDKGLPAHSAPLGMSFWTGPRAPASYRDGALVGLHGCWNCSIPQGYKVVYLAPRADGGFEDAIDLVTGFIAGLADFHQAWGRPVDVIPASSGNLYISDDRAGAVYELYRK